MSKTASGERYIRRDFWKEPQPASQVCIDYKLGTEKPSAPISSAGEELISRPWWSKPQPASQVCIDYKLHELDSKRAEAPKSSIRSAGATIVQNSIGRNPD